MAAALFLGLATIAALAAISSSEFVNMTQCPSCNKMLEIVCAKDKAGNVKTFSNPCLIVFCNCVMNLTKIDRVFTQAYEGKCKERETTVPQCFDEGSSSVSPPTVNISSTEPTSASTPGGRSINTTTEHPSGASGLKTMLLTLALPLAAIPIFL